MPKDLDEEFYKRASGSFEKYVKDYEAAIERSKKIEEAEQRRIERSEQDYEILEKFGAIY